MTFYNNGSVIPHFCGEDDKVAWDPDHILFTFGGLDKDDEYVERYAVLLNPDCENEVYELLAAGAIPWDDLGDLEVARHRYLTAGVPEEHISLILDMEDED